LELVYIPHKELGWSDYRVIYRLVMKHLLGRVFALPLSQTRLTRYGYDKDPPALDDLPLRDGAHIIHDSAHLGVPAFKIMPGEKPHRLDPKHLGAESQFERVSSTSEG
jgi:hypothetical protein